MIVLKKVNTPIIHFHHILIKIQLEFFGCVSDKSFPKVCGKILLDCKGRAWAF